MKIPNNKKLASCIIAGTVVSIFGTVLAVVSSYWFGRRNELDEIIDIGLDKDCNGLNFYKDNEVKYKVKIDAEEVTD